MDLLAEIFAHLRWQNSLRLFYIVLHRLLWALLWLLELIVFKKSLIRACCGRLHWHFNELDFLFLTPVWAEKLSQVYLRLHVCWPSWISWQGFRLRGGGYIDALQLLTSRGDLSLTALPLTTQRPLVCVHRDARLPSHRRCRFNVTIARSSLCNLSITFHSWLFQAALVLLESSLFPTDGAIWREYALLHATCCVLRCL